MNIETMNTTSVHHKDFRTNILDNYCCDEYIFCSNFDSGNLGRVELLKKCSDTEFGENIIHFEFNVWTTPDCYGTPYESPNRTWFFFSIKGGRPYRNVKINVKNLNRQSKLFGQGMQPVLRIGHCGKWERIKNKPTYNIEDENFSMSFIHQPMDKCDIEYFYAFTYPFTYTECENMLEKFDKNYRKSIQDINFIINKLNTEIEEKNSTTKIITIITSQHTVRKQMIDDESGNSSGSSKSLQYQDSASNGTKECQMDATENSATSSLEALKDLTTQEPESPYEKFTQKQLLNEIYYHREPLINSLEGRRVDLLTITSFHGIQNTREDKLLNLFPDPECLRCHNFKDKKIIFMSSRVHPGETPASFVLNGFLNLILDRRSIIAQTLRQLYVFKIVPILNPDGVYRGFYRTDTLGQNLNRMYVNPKLETHPSIYAVKKLIKYYHSGFDNCDSENFSETSSSSSSRSIDLPMKDATLTISNDDGQLFEKKTQSSGNDNDSSLVDVKFESQSCSFQDTVTTTTTTTTATTSSEIEECKNTKSTKLNKNNEIIELEMKSTTFIEKLIPEIRTHILNETAPIITKQKKSLNNNNHGEKIIETNKMKKHIVKGVTSGSIGIRNSDKKLKEHVTSLSIQQRSFNKRVIIKKDAKNMNTIKHVASLSTSNKTLNKRNVLSNHNTNLDITMKTLNTEKGLNDDNTNMFLYIDFHGHASKKGVFMYGNHFSNSSEAVECMLLPRLMSINCHHFHYDACNFSERNMYRREKRDGLSKEGSGRVAIFKMTGLIKSYTLESNYNTGKYVNSLPARGKDNTNHSTKSLNLTPPKYTPAIYEEVGRALGPSILDITNSNVLSRIHNSDFRTLQGLRITLRNEIERGLPNSHRNIGTASSSSTAANIAVVTTAKALNAQQNVKRIKRNARSASSALPQNDTSKENKLIYPISWDTNNPSTSMLQLKSQAGTQSKQLQIKITRNGGGGGSNGNGSKKTTTNIKVRPSSAPMYTTKEFKKKPKALIESSNSSTSCITKKDVATFYIPPKKVKVSNKNIFKTTSMKQSLSSSQPPPPPLPLPSSTLSNVLQNVNNTTIEINCMNCDVSNSNNQGCQISSNSSSLSVSKNESSLCTNSNCKNLKTSIEAQNLNTSIDILPSCSNDKYHSHHCKSIIELNMHPTASSSSYSQSHPNLTTSTSAGNSFRKSRKTEISSSSSSLNLYNISSNEKNLNIKMKSFGGRKKRINRHETIIIKRKKNKLKSTIH